MAGAVIVEDRHAAEMVAAGAVHGNDKVEIPVAVHVAKLDVSALCEKRILRVDRVDGFELELCRRRSSRTQVLENADRGWARPIENSYLGIIVQRRRGRPHDI